MSECKKLRSAFSDAGVDFMAAVMRFEADEAAWKAGVDGTYGWATFGEALHSSDLMKLHRLEKFKQMVKVCGGVDAVRTIGIPAAEEMLLIPAHATSRLVDKPVVQAVQSELVAFREREGKEPSAMTAKSIRIKHCPPQPKPEPETPKVENAYDRLVRENRELKARVRELEKENTALKAQLGERSSDAPNPGTARGARKHKGKLPRAQA